MATVGEILDGTSNRSNGGSPEPRRLTVGDILDGDTGEQEERPVADPRAFFSSDERFAPFEWAENMLNDPEFREEGAKRAAGDSASVLRGLTFGASDTARAGVRSLVTDENFDEAKQAVDADRDEYGTASGEVAGAVMTGGGLAGRGATLLNPNVTARVPGAAGRTMTRMASNPNAVNAGALSAADAAAYGGAYGFGTGRGGFEERLENAGKDAATSAFVGGPLGAIAGRGASRAAQSQVNDDFAVDELKSQAVQLFRSARQSGLQVRPQSYDKMLNDALNDLTGEYQYLGPGFGTTNTDRVLTMLDDFRQRGSFDLGDLDALRSRVGQIEQAVGRQVAGGNADAGDAAMVAEIKHSLTDWLRALKSGDVDVPGTIPPEMAGDMLKDAGDLYRRQANVQTVEGLLERAQMRATGYSQSGMENAIRAEFSTFVRNARNLRSFNTEERAALRNVADAGSLQEMFRWIGRFAPRSIISTLGTGGAGFALGGIEGAMIGSGVGSAGYAVARNLREQAAQRARNIIAGAPAIPRAQMTAGQRGVGARTGSAAAAGTDGRR